MLLILIWMEFILLIFSKTSQLQFSLVSSIPHMETRYGSESGA